MTKPQKIDMNERESKNVKQR